MADDLAHIDKFRYEIFPIRFKSIREVKSFEMKS